MVRVKKPIQFTQKSCKRLLKHISPSQLSHTNRNKNNVLMYACANGMLDVCKAILSYPNDCGIDTVSTVRGSAFSIACKHKMKSVYEKIYQHMGENEKEMIIQSYHNDPVLEMICDNSEKLSQGIKEQTNAIKEYKQEMKPLMKKDKCLICCNESNDTCYYGLNCFHVMSMCEGCKSKIVSACPICRADITTCNKMYIIG